MCFFAKCILGKLTILVDNKPAIVLLLNNCVMGLFFDNLLSNDVGELILGEYYQRMRNANISRNNPTSFEVVRFGIFINIIL